MYTALTRGSSWMNYKNWFLRNTKSQRIRYKSLHVGGSTKVTEKTYNNNLSHSLDIKIILNKVPQSEQMISC